MIDKQQVIERLESMQNLRTITGENKRALKDAVKELKAYRTIDQIRMALIHERDRAIKINEIYTKGTSSEGDIKGYVSGLMYAAALTVDREPQSVLPTDEEIKKIFKKVKSNGR